MIFQDDLAEPASQDGVETYRICELPVGTHFQVQELNTEFRVGRQMPNQELTIAAAQECLMTHAVGYQGGSLQFESSPGAEFEFDMNVSVAEDDITHLPFHDDFFFLMRQFVRQHASEVSPQIEKAIEDYLA